MQYRELGASGIDAYVVGLGTWKMGGWGWGGGLGTGLTWGARGDGLGVVASARAAPAGAPCGRELHRRESNRNRLLCEKQTPEARGTGVFPFSVSSSNKKRAPGGALALGHGA